MSRQHDWVRSERLRESYEALKSRRDEARETLADAMDDYYAPLLKSSYERLVVETNEAYVAWLESTWH